jgi:hypothetical protein
MITRLVSLGNVIIDRTHRGPGCRRCRLTTNVKIMFASLGAYGHLYPMMPLALACADAGHDAVIATGPPFLGQLQLPTVPGYPPKLELDWAVQEARRRHPDLHDQDFSMAMFADVTAEVRYPDDDRAM